MQAGAVETLKFKMWVRSLSSDITDIHLSGLEGFFCPASTYILGSLINTIFTFKTEQYFFKELRPQTLEQFCASSACQNLSCHLQFLRTTILSISGISKGKRMYF